MSENNQTSTDNYSYDLDLSFHLLPMIRLLVILGSVGVGGWILHRAASQYPLEYPPVSAFILFLIGMLAIAFDWENIFTK